MKALTVDFDPAIIKREILSYHVNHGFVDADELLDFIEAYWKLRVPRAQVCPEHTPPSEYIVDSFFEGGPGFGVLGQPWRRQDPPGGLVHLAGYGL